MRVDFLKFKIKYFLIFLCFIFRFIKHFEEKVDMNNSANYSLKAITQWLNLRIQLVSIFLSSFIALICSIFHYYEFTQETSMVSLGLVYSFGLNSLLNGLISSFTTLEIDFVSVERLIQYFNNTEKEKPGMIKLVDFPKRGEICFDNVTFRYKSDSNYALNSITFKIKAGSFIGIIGMYRLVLFYYLRLFFFSKFLFFLNRSNWFWYF